MGKWRIEDLNAGIERSDWVSLARAITIVENGYEGKKELLDHAYATEKENCLILGITGSGGAGKSTLIDRLLQFYSSAGKTVGVLAVDPSSSYTGGAVLGDRIRMTNRTSDEAVFIRSFASRGALGGISQGAKDVLYLYKSFGFDVIIIESVGVGQAETDITNFVDVTAVVMAPGNGDYIQLAKAGTQEIADIFVVNKSDRPEADTLYSQLKATFDFLPVEQQPLLIKVTARENKGIAELTEMIANAAEKLLPGKETKKKMRIQNEIYTGALSVFSPTLEEAVRCILDEVLSGRLSSYEAAHFLGSKISLLQ